MQIPESAIVFIVPLTYVESVVEKVNLEKELKLYKGMPIEEFNKSILKTTDLNSLQYKICYMYYVERKNEVEIAHKVGYSVDNIRKIKSKINKKLKEFS